jgi:hypothetical protein
LIVFSGLTPIPLEIAQMVPLIIKFLKRRFTTATPRDLAEVSGDFPFATHASLNLFLFTVSFIYALLQPLVLVFMLLYFVLFYTVYKYQLLYVYSPQIDYRGKLWPRIQFLAIIALSLGQLSLGLVLFFKGAWYASFAVLPAVLASFGVWYFVLCAIINRGEFLPEDPSELLNVSTGRGQDTVLLQHSAFIGELMQPMVPPHLEMLLPEFFDERRQGFTTQAKMNRILARQSYQSTVNSSSNSHGYEQFD